MNVRAWIQILGLICLFVVGCGEQIKAVKTNNNGVSDVAGPTPTPGSSLGVVATPTPTPAAPTPTPTPTPPPPPPAGIAMSPSTINFGNVPYGQKKQAVVTIKNNFPMAVNLSWASASTGLVPVIPGGSCSLGQLGYGTVLYGPNYPNAPAFVLQPGQECTYVIEWTAVYEDLVDPYENFAVGVVGNNLQYGSKMIGHILQ